MLMSYHRRGEGAVEEVVWRGLGTGNEASDFLQTPSLPDALSFALFIPVVTFLFYEQHGE